MATRCVFNVTVPDTPFLYIANAAILSVIKEAGILSWTSSNAVSLAPWLYGLVSVHSTWSNLPASCMARITPEANKAFLSLIIKTYNAEFQLITNHHNCNVLSF